MLFRARLFDTLKSFPCGFGINLQFERGIFNKTGGGYHIVVFVYEIDLSCSAQTGSVGGYPVYSAKADPDNNYT